MSEPHHSTERIVYRPILRTPPYNQYLLLQVDVGPHQAEQLASSEPCVHRQQHCWCEVIREALGFGKQLALACA